MIPPPAGAAAGAARAQNPGVQVKILRAELNLKLLLFYLLHHQVHLSCTVVIANVTLARQHSQHSQTS